MKKRKFFILHSSLSTQQGFTLIELLIVIVIIGILSSFLLANFIGVRQRARDSQRKSDLRQIQSALELYRADNGTYPIAGGTWFLVGCNGQFISGAVTYMKKTPCDPLTNSSPPFQNGNYYYWTDNTQYTLAACLENANDGDPSDQPLTYSFPASPSNNNCTTKYYILNNP